MLIPCSHSIFLRCTIGRWLKIPRPYALAFCFYDCKCIVTCVGTGTKIKKNYFHILDMQCLCGISYLVSFFDQLTNINVFRYLVYEQLIHALKFLSYLLNRTTSLQLSTVIACPQFFNIYNILKGNMISKWMI